MNRTLTQEDQARIRYLTRRLRHLEKQLAVFMLMNKEQLEADHDLFPVENWRVMVILMETVGKTVNEMADVLP